MSIPTQSKEQVQIAIRTKHDINMNGQFDPSGKCVLDQLNSLDTEPSGKCHGIGSSVTHAAFKLLLIY